MSDDLAVDAVQIPFGKDIATGRMLHIREIPREKNGLACGCVCAECERRLIARQGDVNAWCFAHEASEHNCVYGPETSVHEASKQLLLDAGLVTVPALYAKHPNGFPHHTPVEQARVVRLTELRKELVMPGMRPDVIGTQPDGSPLLVEILVEHAVGRVKLARIAERQLAAIEIVMTGFRASQTRYYRDAVLHTAPRHWLWHPKQADLDTALAREIAEAEEARRKAAAALAERLAKEAAERVERRAREAAERRHAEAEEAERLARELEAERLAEEARLAVEDAEAEARQEQYLRDLEVWQAESAKRREAALLAFANRVPIALAWAADYYPVRAALPPSLVFEEDDILRLFELCPSRRAHLALVDQPAIRRWFSNPRCRVAAKAAWDRYAGAP